jgi:very-short-patch-repair endonuclease
VVVVDGIPAMSIARTLMALGALVPRDLSDAQLLDVVSAAIETRAASLPWLHWVLEERRCRGRDGVTAFERALDARERVGPTESWLERRLIELVDEAGLPRPALQRRIARQRGRPARVDFLYLPERIVVEVLGYAFHRSPEQITADTMRANELQVAGYQVLQLTSRLIAEDPGAAQHVIAAALAARSPSVAAGAHR